MSRLLRFAGMLAAATAGSYLAWLTALFTLTAACPLLLAAFTRVEVTGLRIRLGFPGLFTRFPAEGSALLYALYHGGFIVAGAAALVAAALLQRRMLGWSRLFLAHSVLWTGALYAAMLSGGLNFPGASLEATLRVLGPDGPGRLVPFWIVAAALVLPAAYAAVRGLEFVTVAAWILMPLLIVGATLDARLLRARTLLGLSPAYWPVALAVLAGLAAAGRRATPAPALRLGFAGGTTLLGLAALLFGSLTSWPALGGRLQRKPELSEQRSRHWILRFDAAIPPSRRAQLAAAADQRLETLSTRLGIALADTPLQLWLYATPEAKAVATGSDAAYTVRAGQRAVHHLLDPGGNLTDQRGDALLLMETQWGSAGSEGMARALARYAAGDFHGSALAVYAAGITRAEGPYPLRGIFGQDSDYLSPLVRDALGGAWVESAVAKDGAACLRRLYSESFPGSPAAEDHWRQYQLNNAARFPAPPSRPTRAAYFHRGISFSHEVGADYGYGSERARAQLERIRGVNANTVALIPYAFTRAPRETAIRFGADERDDRVIRSLQQAKRLGLHVMLKPQLWGPTFTGDIIFTREGDFDRWFGQYRRWLLHYARLSELYDADLLVIGTELTGVTSHEAAWRGLIADIRRIYHGPLTYAASWGRDFENVPFWDALDYLGVNMYYPLAGDGEAPRVDSPRVESLISKFAAAAARYHKPVLFTEIGYPAQTTAASRPWEWNGGGLDADLQRRCYEAVFEAFYRRPWFAGLYWWKWPSHGEGNRFDTSFNPIGKPALQVVARWYAGVRPTGSPGAP